MPDAIFKNGTVVNARGIVKADVAVSGGKIVEIAPQIASGSMREIDCEGKLLLPGLIDPHVHLRDPGFPEKETFETGTSAAAAAGVTTIFDMPNTNPPTVDEASLDIKAEIAAKSAKCGYAFFVAATPSNIEELPNLLRRDYVCGVKLFLGSTTGDMLMRGADVERLFAEMKRRGCKKPVAFHGELQSSLELRAGAELAKFPHYLRRPAVAGIDGMRLAAELSLKYGVPVHACHLSLAEEASLLARLKAQGADITAETTPQHALMDGRESWERIGAKSAINPPVRRLGDRNALIAALAAGTIDCLSTDHAPHTEEEKNKDKFPSGMPGLDTLSRLGLLFARGGRLDLTRFAASSSFNAAKRFGLRGKGAIREGFDADIIIYDQANIFALSPLKKSELKTKCGWSAFEGALMCKPPEEVYIGGELAARSGELIKGVKGIAAVCKP